MQSVLISLSQYPDRDDGAVFAAFVVDLDGDSLPPQSGVVRFTKSHELRPGDEFQIDLERVITGDVGLAKADVSAINAFPNPYYGINSDETSLSDRFITFNHLPAKVVIRIYNLAGIHVRKLVKDDATTQYFRWDLNNEYEKRVGSGIYIAYMELQDERGNNLGTKTLKLAVIQEEHP